MSAGAPFLLFLFLYIIFQKLIYLVFRRRTPFQGVSEASGTTADTQFSFFPLESLSDTDLCLQFSEKPLLLQFIKRRDQIAVAGTAGFHLLHSILKLHDFSPGRHVKGMLLFIAGTKHDPGKISTSHSQFLRHFYIWHLLCFILQKMTYIGITEHRVSRR